MTRGLFYNNSVTKNLSSVEHCNRKKPLLHQGFILDSQTHVSPLFCATHERKVLALIVAYSLCGNS